jgi:hypothetical protein
MYSTLLKMGVYCAFSHIVSQISQTDRTDFHSSANSNVDWQYLITPNRNHRPVWCIEEMVWYNKFNRHCSSDWIVNIYLYVGNVLHYYAIPAILIILLYWYIKHKFEIRCHFYQLVSCPWFEYMYIHVCTTKLRLPVVIPEETWPKPLFEFMKC